MSAVQTGIVRKIDELGRIAIPKELRRSLRWMAGDELEILSYSDGVYVRRSRSADLSTRLEDLKEETAKLETLTPEQLSHVNETLQNLIDYLKNKER